MVKNDIQAIQSELVEVLERVMGLIEKVEQLVGDEVGKSPRARAEKRPVRTMRPAEGVRQVGARSEEPASPPTSSPKPKAVPPRKPAVGVGIKPKLPEGADRLPECPCVNPSKDECEHTAPAGIHTRGTGAAAQYSRCRFYDVRVAMAHKPKGRFNGPAAVQDAPKSSNGMSKKRCPGYEGHECGQWITWKSTRCRPCTGVLSRKAA